MEKNRLLECLYMKLENLPQWDLSDLYSGPEAAEFWSTEESSVEQEPRTVDPAAPNAVFLTNFLRSKAHIINPDLFSF